jgi:hypothetical protein
MSVGSSILQLLGQQDPRQQLIQSIVGQASGGPGGAQYAGDPTAAAPTTAPAAGATSAPMPDGLKSPPDLAAMYGDLMKYQSRAGNIDRGFGLIGSSISQDANRSDTLRSFTGDTDTTSVNPASIADLALSMQKNKALQASRAAQIAGLPAIAARLGIPMVEARSLMESGKLDEVLANFEKPDRAAQIDALGRPVVTDLKTGAQIGGPAGPAKPQIVDGANGSKYLFDPEKQEVGKQLLPPDMSTTDTKDYAAYMDDEVTRGTEPAKIMSLQEWRMTKPPSTAVTNNINNSSENAFSKKSGENFADDYQKIRGASKTARELLGQYDLVQKALDAGLETGATADAVAAARRIGLAAGLDVDQSKLQGAELIKAVTNQMALTMRNPESGMGMPGSLSDKDIQFLKQANVGIDTSTGGNKTLLKAFRAIQERRIEVGKLANQYVKDHKQLDAGFDDLVTNYNEANPIFEDFQLEGDGKGPDVNVLVDKYKTRKK